MSYAEQLVLDEFHRQAPGDWMVMHSIWLKEHQSKQHAEIDFLVITNRAALILEVKGGVVFRDQDGMWHFSNRNMSEERLKTEGPFDQARSAYYSVRKYLDDAGWLHLFHDRVWGYGVVLPQCILQTGAPDPAIAREMLLDERAFPNGLLSFIDELTAYWEEDNLRMKDKLHIPRERLQGTISASERDQLRDLLRPMLRPVQGVALSAREAEIRLLDLTKEQCKALDFHDPSQPLILQGAAGTGKTMIAMQQVHRRSFYHNRLLFVCFNRTLAACVRKSLGPETVSRGVDVFNYHQLLGNLNRQAFLPTEPIEDWAQFNREVEDRTLYALQTLQDRGTPFQQYDYLILDEAQDLMTPEFLGSLEMLLRGGWQNGAWTLCIDPRQVIFHDQYDEDQFERLKKHASICPLSLNCRNTREVAAYAHGLSGVEGVPTRPARGPEPQLVWYPNRQQYAKRIRKTVNQLIDEMSDLAPESRGIVILAVTKDSLPDEIFTPGFFRRRAVKISSDANHDVVQCGTLQSFKGLESMAVVLVGLEDIDAIGSRQLAYVGGSRAKSFLRILLPDRIQTSVQERLPDILTLLAKE